MKFLALLVCCLSCIQAVTIIPPTVTDIHGNFADDRSQISFAAVPEGEPYVTNPEEYTYNGLLPLFKGVQGFVHICFYAEAPFGKFWATKE